VDINNIEIIIITDKHTIIWFLGWHIFTVSQIFSASCVFICFVCLSVCFYINNNNNNNNKTITVIKILTCQNNKN